MGQQEVYTFFKEHSDEWVTSEEIRIALGVSKHSVQENLSRMRRMLDVENRMTDSHWTNYYKLKREK